MDDKYFYKKATGVDIDKVYQDCEYSRAVGYDGEFCLFRYLFSQQSGKYEHSKILANLEIPVAGTAKKTEIDMVFITEYGLFVFEVKNYKGTIYGRLDDKKWTQYFKTAKNETFYNPIKQNAYHLEALSKIVPEKTYSVVLFANDDCNITNVPHSFQDGSGVVCDSSTLFDVMNSVPDEKVLSAEKVNDIFDTLKQFSKISESSDLYSQSGCETFNDLRKNMKKFFNEKLFEERRRLARHYACIATLVCIIIGVVSAFFIFKVLDYSYEKVMKHDQMAEKYEQMEKEYSLMLSNFSEVSADDLALSNQIVSVSNVTVEPHSYYEGFLLKFRVTKSIMEASVDFAPYAKKQFIYIELTDGNVQRYECTSKNRSTSKLFNKDSYCDFEMPIAYSLDHIRSIRYSPVAIEDGFDLIREIELKIY